MYAQAIDETEMSYQTLMDYKWVAGAIEISLRNENVPFHVHRAIAPLHKEKQAEAIQKAANEAWTVREAKSKVRQITFNGGNPVPLPSDKFRVIYADPPWKYGDTRDGVKGYSAAADHCHIVSKPVQNNCRNCPYCYG